MRVLRVEHLYCPSGKPHGPNSWGTNCPASEWPRFGTRGPTPDGDAPNCRIQEHEICGVLPEQFDAWWSSEERDLLRHDGWTISEYEVPDEDVTVLRWQVLFPRDVAKRVNAHYDPKPFILCRRADLPPVGVSASAYFREPYTKPEFGVTDFLRYAAVTV